MSLRYSCLVLDHDDTVVDSIATVHYPSFLETLSRVKPDFQPSLTEYRRLNHAHGFEALCYQVLGFSQADMLVQNEVWFSYMRLLIPPMFPGMAQLLRAFRAAGGHICVVSHSWASYIRRDYRSWGAPEPELIYDWSLPACFRKPSPWPLWEISRILGVAPREMLMVDDLQPGRSMARSAGVDFAAAGWAEAVPDVRLDMQTGGGVYCESVSQLANLLFSGQ